MNNDLAIKVENVSKKYCKSLKKSMLYGIKYIARNTLGLSSQPQRLRKDEFWAVDGVSFEVKKAEVLGIVGPNGSGKTTILKVLNGIFWPDKGKVTIKGVVGALIEAGAGFHHLLTGRENIYINAAILGMTKKEVDEKFDEIVDFADIKDFIDTPVKFYSSGMFVRLGFAVAVHCHPDILLVDEVLAVGDFAFQKKCHNKIREFIKQNKTIVFVSHNLGAIKNLCSKVVYLDRGVSIAQGNPEEVIDCYLIEGPSQKYRKELKKEYSYLKRRDIQRWGSGEIEIVEVKFFDAMDKENNIFKSGEKFTVRLKYRTQQLIKSPVFGIAIYRDDGTYCAGIDTKHSGYRIEGVNGTGVVECTIDALPLLRGTYLVTAAVLDELDSPYDQHDQKYEFKVVSGETEDRGIFQMPVRWEIK